MPLSYSPDIPGNRELLIAGMQHAVAAGALPSARMPASGREASLVQFTAALPIHTFSPADLLKDSFPGNAPATGWLYFILADGSPAGIAILSIMHGEQNSESTTAFTEFREGRITALLLEALRLGEQLATNRNLSFEVRFLESTPLYYAALWLHPPNGDDILIPLDMQNRSDSVLAVQTPPDALRSLRNRLAPP